MGICGSNHDGIYKDQYLKQFKTQFEALTLSSSDVHQLLRFFRRIDVDGSNTINIVELWTHLELEGSKFTDRIFSIFDEDNSGQIDFREFVLSVWNYCTLSKATLALFAFDLYDNDSNGELSPEEVERMLHDIYGNQAGVNPQAKLISNELQAIGQNYVLDVGKFCSFVNRHPALLFPAFQVQHHLQTKILGERFWAKAANRRIKLSDGKFIPMSQLATLNVNQELYEKYAHSQGNNKAGKQAALALQSTGTAHFRKNMAEFKKTHGIKNGVEVKLNEEEKPLKGKKKRNQRNSGSAKSGDGDSDLIVGPVAKFVAVKDSKEERMVQSQVDPLQRMYDEMQQNTEAKMIKLPAESAPKRPKTAQATSMSTENNAHDTSVNHTSHRPKTAQKNSTKVSPADETNDNQLNGRVRSAAKSKKK